MEKGWLLVATENREKARHISKIFEDANFLNPIAFATSAEKTMALLKQEEGEPRPVQLLFLELATEWCWSLLEEIQNVSELSKLPVVALVNGNEELLDRAYEMGVKTYLRMPFTFPQFLERSRLLNLRYVILRNAD